MRRIRTILAPNNSSAEAVTLRGLAPIAAVGPGNPRLASGSPLQCGAEGGPTPASAGTLVEILEAKAQAHPDRTRAPSPRPYRSDRGPAGRSGVAEGRGPDRVPRPVGHRGLFPQPGGHARRPPRGLDGLGRPGLPSWRGAVRHRPPQGADHQRRPQHLPAGDRGGRGGDPWHPQGMRRGVWRRSPGDEDGAPGRRRREPRDNIRGAQAPECLGCQAGRRRGGDPTGPCRHRGARVGAEDLEREAPPRGNTRGVPLGLPRNATPRVDAVGESTGGGPRWEACAVGRARLEAISK